jgi:hypothetical protein
MIRNIVIFLIFYSPLVICQNYGGWIFADSMNFAREYSSSVILDNNEVLVAGGSNIDLLKSCEIYNRMTNEWRNTDSMNRARGVFNLVKLLSGKAIAISGFGTKTCEIYDPQTEEWTLTDSIKTLRFDHMTTTLLNNGKVLIGGGFYFPSNYTSECELYDPLTETWSLTDSLNYGRSHHTMTLLNDGRVLVVGGRNSQTVIAESEIYNPSTDQWEVAASLNIPRYWHSVTLLPDGKVLVAGGETFVGFPHQYTNICELYDPVLDEWSIVGPMYFINERSYGILLDNQRILFTSGGFTAEVWELYDYVNFQSIHQGFMPVVIYDPTVLKLNTGEIISIGGYEIIGITLTPTKKVLIYNSEIPVELLTFSANISDNAIQLNWMTASEINNQGFEIERMNNNNWEKIGYIDGYGTTTETKSYTFTDEEIFSGTYQYRLKQIDFDGSFEYSKVIEVDVEFPIEYLLFQNYPNPFNPSTKIKYQLPRTNFVTLKVFDALGKKIKTLVSEEQPSGNYEIEFDGRNLSSGIYYYRMQAEDFVDTKKFILMK